jgi:hypothetical protein
MVRLKSLYPWLAPAPRPSFRGSRSWRKPPERHLGTLPAFFVERLVELNVGQPEQLSDPCEYYDMS